jgi:ADP-ribose pyrophosphatase YjhB (NUDIX family)
VTTKRSVALVIRQPGSGRRVLVVKRPPDDEDLPNVWGLPAGSLRVGESWSQAVERAAREKLGVEVEAGALLNEGRADRRGYVLHMRLYEAALLDGQPDVDQPVRGTTRYVSWTWAEPEVLATAAEAGSLCSRLFLEVA